MNSTKSDTNRLSLVNGTRFFIIEKYKTVYTEMPKVACSSFKIWIADLLSIDFDKDKWEYIHELELPMKVGYEMQKYYSDYFKFCFVRNPWDRLLSCWLSKIKTEDYDDGKNWKKGVENNFWRYGDLFWTEMPFSDFINSVLQIPDIDSDAHFRSQYTFIFDKENKPVVDFIGKLENIDNDFSYVCDKLGNSEITLPHVHKQDHKHYREYYDSNTSKKVGDRYIHDIELFKYQF